MTPFIDPLNDNKAHWATVVFCLKCGSPNVDINHWVGADALVLRCSNCGDASEVRGFTFGRLFLENGDIPTGSLASATSAAPHLPQPGGAPGSCPIDPDLQAASDAVDGRWGGGRSEGES